MIVVFVFFLVAFLVFQLSFGQTSVNSWNKTYGGAYGGTAFSVIQTEAGGYTVLGSYHFGEYYPLPESRDTWLIATDFSGNTILDKKFNLGLNDMPIGAVQTSNGDYLIVGNLAGGFNGIPAQYYLLKLDSSGNLLWNETFGNQAWKMAQTKNGDFAILSILVGEPKATDLSIFHASDPRIPYWSHSFSFSDYTVAKDMIATSDGGFVIGGSCWEKQNGYAWLMKIDAQGKIQQNSTLTYSDSINTLIQTEDGGYLLADRDHITKIDSNLNLQWTKYIVEQTETSTASIDSITLTSDGGYAFAIKYLEGSIDDYRAVGIAKVGSSGNLQWSKWYYGTNAHKIIQTKDGGYALVGEVPLGLYGKHYGLFIKTNAAGITDGEIQLPKPTPTPTPPPFTPTPTPTKTPLPTLPSKSPSSSSLPLQIVSENPVLFAVLVVLINFAVLGAVVCFTKTRRKNLQNTVKTVENPFSFCPYCGKELPKDLRTVCPSCGKKLPPT